MSRCIVASVLNDANVAKTYVKRPQTASGTYMIIFMSVNAPAYVTEYNLKYFFPSPENNLLAVTKYR
jgi:hypothetical protein